MNIHEYQAKALLQEYNVAVPPGKVATTPAEAEDAARALGAPVMVVKAQVHAGGRGKAGGIKLAKSTSEVKTLAGEILGMTLRSHQTGPEGKVVRKVYVEAGSEVDRELYLGMLLDRAAEKHAIIASTEGGMDIEEVAAKHPGEDPDRPRRPELRPLRLPGAPDRLRTGARRGSGEAAGRLSPRALQALRREGRVPRRDQSRWW